MLGLMKLAKWLKKPGGKMSVVEFEVKEGELVSSVTHGEMRIAPPNLDDKVSSVMPWMGCNICDKTCRMSAAPAESPTK